MPPVPYIARLHFVALSLFRGLQSVLAADGSAGHELRPLRARLFCGRGRPCGSCPCRAARVAVTPPRLCLGASGGALGVPPPLPRVTGRRARAPAVRRRVPSRYVFRAAPLRSASPSALPLPAPLPPAPSGALALPRFLGCRSCRVPLALDARGPFALGFLGSGAHRLASARRLGVSVSPPRAFFLFVRVRAFRCGLGYCVGAKRALPPVPRVRGRRGSKAPTAAFTSPCNLCLTTSLHSAIITNEATKHLQ